MMQLPTEVVILGSSPKFNMAWYLPLKTFQSMGKEIIADPKEEIYPEQKYSAVVLVGCVSNIPILKSIEGMS